MIGSYLREQGVRKVGVVLLEVVKSVYVSGVWSRLTLSCAGGSSVTARRTDQL